MQFNPSTGAIVSGVATFVAIIAAMSPSVFPGYIPPSVAADIIQTAIFGNVILAGMGGFLHLYSSSEPGPLAPPDTPAVKAAMTAPK